MGGANEYLLQNKELNYISKGFLWSLWNLLPIAGTIIMIIKILNRILRSTSSKVLMFIALIIPVVNIASIIVFYVLVFKRIGGKFLIGLVPIQVPVLLGIFAAIGAPLYTGYVERARVTMATSIMGAIITSQEVEKQRTTNYYAIPLAGGVSDITAFRTKGIDISDTKFFTYQTAVIGVKPGEGFTITATTTDYYGAAGGWITFTYDPTATPTASWTSDGSIILPYILPTQPGG
ncbi:MAG: type IV pilin protein [Candidatus Hodarchaeota archaeon]